MIFLALFPWCPAWLVNKMRIIHTLMFAIAVASLAGCSDEAVAKKAMKKAIAGEKLTEKDIKGYIAFTKKKSGRELTQNQAKQELAAMGPQAGKGLVQGDDNLIGEREDAY